MNAIDPQLAEFAVPDASGDAPTDLHRRALPPIRWTGLGYIILFVALAALWAAAPISSHPALAALRGTRLVPIALGSLTIGLAGLAGAAILTSARLRAHDPAPTRRVSTQRFRLRLPRRPFGDPALIGRAARWPQALLVAPLAFAAIALAALPPAGPTPGGTNDIGLGAILILLTFPLLVAERLFAAMPTSRLPEAPALRRLLLIPVLAWPIAGLIRIAAGLGVRAAPAIEATLAVALSLLAAELALRAVARAFLPPPAPAAARAAIDPLLARILADGIARRSLAAPVRAHLGIDFSRSWALLFFRQAALPIVALLALVTWGISGLVLIGIDSRAIYERFGAPVRVLGPGLHAILPWPMGQTRRLEYGIVHEISPGLAEPPASIAAAEGPAPPDADRLWEQAHPAEQTLLVASPAAGSDGTRQSFQVVSADIRLRYRVGMTEAAALEAAYAAAEPETLMRAVAGRVIAGFAAGRTLDQLLGENRERIGETLRTEIQSRLDADRTGLEISAVVIEAIHPPAGAAEAYHAVQAAGILAVASISAERGRAAATLAHASQYAASLIAQSQAAGVEATARATADFASFVADRESAAAHPVSFPLERRLTALGASLAKSVLTVIDRRIPTAGAPTIDLRPLTPVTAASTPPNAE